METLNGRPSDLESPTGSQAVLQSFFMIIFSEIGDKTFLIAAILAMRHPRLTVFAGAFGSLVVMSFLSAIMGHVLPALIPKRWTQFAAAVLFFAFGGKMVLEGRAMEGGEKMQEEMREAEEEIEGDAAKHDGTGQTTANGEVIPLEDIEAGEGVIEPAVASGKTKEESWVKGVIEGTRNLFSLFLGPVFVQAFALTFLGEWGDRSQIATIALAAAHNLYLVSIGTIIGHSCCTALAVIGGRYVSTKISPKHVTLGGAFLFLSFGFIYLYTAIYMTPELESDSPFSSSSSITSTPNLIPAAPVR
ncbi:UPF0016-domain-containing protein [Stereum hirsutum FP-91666 SS1]|uniref:UPF0016-domain-containing protein n=1 Tax=Stereum hirsutum (strain FP-91666) TaxID=721885 RepID=UPI000440D4BA|nr:UPF0016-domain-containing protein [Stereum hirsutum FP-91666 SS1]EIM91183.1 UPF0016-domain-containing protein [Stereum hirsutum FP-91666 SS1]